MAQSMALTKRTFSLSKSLSLKASSARPWRLMSYIATAKTLQWLTLMAYSMLVRK